MENSWNLFVGSGITIFGVLLGSWLAPWVSGRISERNERNRGQQRTNNVGRILYVEISLLRKLIIKKDPEGLPENVIFKSQISVLPELFSDETVVCIVYFYMACLDLNRQLGLLISGKYGWSAETKIIESIVEVKSAVDGFANRAIEGLQADGVDFSDLAAGDDESTEET